MEKAIQELRKFRYRHLFKHFKVILKDGFADLQKLMQC